MAEDTKLTWELTSPFTFGQVLEYWVQQYCETCGRGNMVCVYGQTVSQTSLTAIKVWTPNRASSTPTVRPQQDKLKQLQDCWNGVFCTDCGRGGYSFPASPQAPVAEPTTNVPAVAAVVGHVPKDVLHQIFRDCVLGSCAGCSRLGKPDIRRSKNTPMPLSLVMDAWYGRNCHICGRGTVPRSFEAPTSTSYTPPPCQPLQSTSRTKITHRHHPYKQTITKKPKGLVEQYKQRNQRT